MALPAGWTVDRIRDRTSGIVGGEWGDDPDDGGEGVDISVIRVADIRDLDVETSGLTLRRVKHSKVAERLVGPQTILLEKSGGGENKPVGRAVRTRRITFDAICSNFMAKFDCLKGVDSSFVVYAMHGLYSCGANEAHIQQTTGIQNLRVFDYLNTEIAFPPVAEQHRIAAFLDASCAAIDAAVAAKRAQVEVLESIWQSNLQLALTTGIGADSELVNTGSVFMPVLPLGWRLLRLKNVADIRYGLGQPPPAKTDGVPMIRATNVDAGRIIKEDDFLRVDPDALPLDRRPYLEAGEIIVVRSGAYTADSAIVRKQHVGAVAGYDMVVTVPRADPEFVAYSLLSGYVLKDQLLQLTLRAAQPHLNADELGGIFLAVPRRADQHAIVAYLDQKLAEIQLLTTSIQSQITTLTAYRKSLIHECVTGQRRITDADLQRLGAPA